MKTTLTSGQLGLQLKTFDEKGMTPERWQLVLESGLFADLCDPSADLGNRPAYRAALGLPPLGKKFLGAPMEFTYSALPAPVDPHEFFQTRNGLWVDPDFVRWILPAADKLSALSEHTGRHQSIIALAKDKEIRDELSPDHVWEASEWCARFADKIQRQWSNKAQGDLVNNGYANISYVVGEDGEVFTVCVDWNAGHGEWDVYACRLLDGRWGGGSWVFPRN